MVGFFICDDKISSSHPNHNLIWKSKLQLESLFCCFLAMKKQRTNDDDPPKIINPTTDRVLSESSRQTKKTIQCLPSSTKLNCLCKISHSNSAQMERDWSSKYHSPWSPIQLLLINTFDLASSNLNSSRHGPTHPAIYNQKTYTSQRTYSSCQSKLMMIRYSSPHFFLK